MARGGVEGRCLDKDGIFVRPIGAILTSMYVHSHTGLTLTILHQRRD